MKIEIFILVATAIAATTPFNLENRAPIVKKGEQFSYFGYSVAQHKIYEGGNWMLVGAPLAQNLQPETTKSGALFKCPITNKTFDCEQVITDGLKSEDDLTLHRPEKNEIKDGQWMGVTVRSQGPDGKVLVCAHRYVINMTTEHFVQGRCYTLKNNLEFDMVLEPCRGRPTSLGHMEFGVCQAGTNAHLLPDGTALIGSPGPYIWRGTIFVIAVDGDFLSRDKQHYTGPLKQDARDLNPYSYLGMSVAAGRFFEGKENVYVSGAPRSNGTGQVFLLAKKGRDVMMEIKMKLNGEQIASSFGYEIASVDINNDGYSDLIVGAPFYFTRDEGGAVYVYMNNPTSKTYLRNAQPKKFTGKPESRFGFAITSLGDINKDGYNDVAIGAPYENNRGAIYIYLGSASGLQEQPSQIIRTNRIPSTLGYSLSGGMDMDNNGYPDLLVGAYESDAVLLYLARPIIDVLIEVDQSQLKNIDFNHKSCPTKDNVNVACVQFRTCCILRPQRDSIISNEIQLEYHIEAESGKKFSRVYFDDDPMQSKKRHDINVRRGERNCKWETLYIKENIVDLLSPIKLHVRYNLKNNEENSPILNQQNATKNFTATFLKNCGTDELCESNMILDARFVSLDKENEYSMDDELKIEIDVNNLGEPAYEAQLFVFHSKGLGYIAVGNKTNIINCNYRNGTLVVCNLGNPFKKDHTKVELRFQPLDDQSLQHEVRFDVLVNSTSTELSNQTRKLLRAKVVKKAEIEIRASVTSVVFYGGEVRGESAMMSLDDIGSRVVHTYQVINNGPNKVDRLEVEINWPVQVGNGQSIGKWLLYLDEIPLIEGAQGACFYPSQYLNPLRLRPKTHTRDESSENRHSRAKRSTGVVIRPEIIVDKDGHTRKIVNMNCFVRSAICIVIKCQLVNISGGDEITIRIKSRLWNSTLVEDYPRVDWVQIMSNAKVVIPPEYVIEQNTSNDFANATTSAYPDLDQQEPEPVPKWIYIVSGIIGILLLVIIVFILWKLGFFKRRRYDHTLSGSLKKKVSEENEPLNASQ